MRNQSPFRNSSSKEKIPYKNMDDRVRNHSPQYDSAISAIDRDFCEQLLQKNLEDRLGYRGRAPRAWKAEAIERHQFFADISWLGILDGKVPSPFVPDPRAVYARDLTDIRPHSVAGVKLSEEDQYYYSGYSAAVTNKWQQDILDTVFDEVSPFDSAALPVDLREGFHEPRGSLLSRTLRRRVKRPVFDLDDRKKYLRERDIRGAQRVSMGANVSESASRHVENA